MKSVYPTVCASCQEFVDSDTKVLTKHSICRFLSRTFMRTMFAIEILGPEEEELLDNQREMFDPSSMRMIQQAALLFFPRMANFLRMKFMPKPLDDYFRSLVSTILNTRMGAESGRGDFVDVLMQMRKSEKLSVFNREKRKMEIFDITDEIVQSQTLFFYVAGLEPTSLSLLHTAFDLAVIPDCQNRAREEVRSVLKKYGGHCWEAVKDMVYLQCCIKESLRIHPSLQFLNRVSNRDTEIGGIKIKKGTRIVIPTHTMQMDPKYFPNPEKYEPERFLEKMEDKFCYLPFSEGPRVCLGKRFAIIEVATFLAYLLDNFELSLSLETKLPLKYEAKTLFLTPKYKNEVKINLRRLS